MAAQLNHTIAWCRDQKRSAEFLTYILGLPPAKRFMHFLVVDLSNDVSIDFMESSEDVALQHFAFLISEEEFDSALERIREREVQIWADPGRKQPDETNHHFGG